MYVHSTDGVTIEATAGRLPTKLTRRLDTNEWQTPTEATAADFGWYLATEVGTDQGPGWSLAPPANVSAGVFTRTWTFDQAIADAIIDQADRDVDAVALRDDLQNAKNIRDEAVQSRTDMDHETPDPAALAKWAPVAEDDLGGVDRTGNQASQITALQDRVDELTLRQRDSARLANDLRIEMRRMYGDIRLTAAMLVRKFRKDRDDV